MSEEETAAGIQNVDAPTSASEAVSLTRSVPTRRHRFDWVDIALMIVCGALAIGGVAIVIIGLI